MYENIQLIINYFKLKNYLTGKLNYKEHEAISAIKNIRKMEPDIRKAFLIWFKTGKTPEGEFHGINFNNLMTYRNLNPVSTFLAIDWYVKDPQAAYTMIAMPQKDSGDSLVNKTEIAEILKKFPNGKISPEPENTDDITE